jgi:pyruvate formate lyase activating enzyme
LNDGVHLLLRERCDGAGRCVEACSSEALQLEGRRMTVDQVMEEVVRDKPFYAGSGGGVTLSGGEPALGGNFARELLRTCKENGLHTAIETCGEYPWTLMEALLPVTDMVMMDIKQMAPEAHRRATGQSNDRILNNARQLALTAKPLIFRTPVIPTVNDSEDQIGEIARFVGELIALRRANDGGVDRPASIRYELLAFHSLASDKYRSLDREYRASGLHPPTMEKMTSLRTVAERHGVETSTR